jgi:hypothetical protein
MVDSSRKATASESRTTLKWIGGKAQKIERITAKDSTA